MNYPAFSGLVNGIAASVIGIFVYSRNSRDPRYITYGLACLSVSVWSYFYFFWAMASQEYLALFFCRALMAGAIFIPITCFHHVVTLLGLADKKRRLIVFGYVAAFVFLIVDFTPLFVKDVSPKLSFKFWSNPGGIFFHIYLFMFSLTVFYFLFLIFKAYRNSTGVVRNQMKYLLIALSIGFSGGSTNFPLWYDIPIYPFGTIFVSIYVAILAYAIIRHRLMDIQVAFSKSLVAVLLGACVIGFDILFVKFLHPVLGYYFSGAIAMLIIGGVLFATPLSRKLQLGMDQMVLGGKYNYQNILREARMTILTILNLDELVNYIINMLRQSLSVDKIALLMKTKTGAYKLEYGHGVEEQLQSGYEIKGGIIEWLENKKEIFVKEEQRDIDVGAGLAPAQMFGDLEKLGAELVVPLFHRGELEGILTLSAKGTGEPYVQSDIDLFEMLGANISTAIRNARVYNEAVTDSLTGLYRHEYFQLRLAEEIEKSKRNRSFLSLLVIDLDQFKEINERYGSDVRDIVLKRLAIILRKNVEKTDIVSRYGTDGFAMILFGANSNLVAERLRKEVAREEFVVGAGPCSRPFVGDGHARPEEGSARPAPMSIRMTVSIGVACFDGVGAGSEPALTEKGMLIRANSAAAAVKKRGGNGVDIL